MYDKMISRIAAYSFKKSSLANEDKEICVYGLNLILSTVINFMVILSIGTLCNKLYETIIFMLVYSSIRSQAGGYHAKSKEACLILFVLGFIVMLASVQYIRLPLYVVGGLLLLCNIIVVELSPVEPIGIFLGPITRKKMRRKACFISFVFSIFACILLLCEINWAIYVVMGIFTISLVLILGKINLIIGQERDI